MVEGLFITTRKKLHAIYGKHAYFGEILGKHSEVYFDIEESMFKVKSVDQALITELEGIFGGQDVSGYNPLHYVKQ